jgi:hypothetical protein
VIQKKTNCTIWKWHLQKKTKSDVSFRVFYSSQSDDLQILISSLWVQLFFWSKMLTSDWPFFRSSTKSFNFSCASVALIYVQTLINFNLWSYTLKHILAYLIVLQYFVIFKTLKTLYKTNFVPTNVSDHYSTLLKVQDD